MRLFVCLLRGESRVRRKCLEPALSGGIEEVPSMEEEEEEEEEEHCHDNKCGIW